MHCDAVFWCMNPSAPWAPWLDCQSQSWQVAMFSATLPAHVEALARKARRSLDSRSICLVTTDNSSGFALVKVLKKPLEISVRTLCQWLFFLVASPLELEHSTTLRFLLSTLQWEMTEATALQVITWFQVAFKDPNWLSIDSCLLGWEVFQQYYEFSCPVGNSSWTCHPLRQEFLRWVPMELPRAYLLHFTSP